jgi:adenine deaminase
MEELIKVSLGEASADLLLEGEMLNVYTGELLETNIAVKGGLIAYVGKEPRPALNSLKIRKGYILPAFIDGHIHIESSLLTPSRFAVAVIPRGTCCVVTDPHEIANVMGVEGIKYMIKDSSRTPLKVYVTIPSCVPSTSLETSGSSIGVKEINEIKKMEQVIGLGEVMDFPGVLSRDPEVLAKIRACKGLVIDGHAPGLRGAELSAYISAGIYSDHESVSMEEAYDKLSKGMMVMVREGSASKNLSELIGLVSSRNSRRFMLVTDDKSADDLMSEGHLDHSLRRAVEEGVDPVEAVRMVTLNPAEYFGLKQYGGIAPGKVADITVVNSLDEFEVNQVFINGVLLAKNGECLVVSTEAPPPIPVLGTMNFNPVGKQELAIRYSDGSEVLVRVIVAIDGQIITGDSVELMRAQDGLMKPDVGRDILKVCVVERHKGTGRVGKGFVKGFGLNKGAIASSIAHDSHNIISVGVDDGDIIAAVNHLREINGGLVVYHEKPLAELRLPVAGLMSDRPAEKVVEDLKRINEAAASLGCKLSSPFSTISFLALPVIPELKITDRGLVDVTKHKLVDIFTSLDLS